MCNENVDGKVPCLGDLASWSASYPRVMTYMNAVIMTEAQGLSLLEAGLTVLNCSFLYLLEILKAAAWH